MISSINYIQLFEWYVIYYLIKAQQNQKIEEILFEHNH